MEGALPVRVVVVRVGEVRLALDAEAVADVTPAPVLAPLRGAPGGITGLAEHGGRSLPVFDLHWKLGLRQPGEFAGQMLVVLVRPPAALLVDACEGPVTLREGDASAIGLASGRLGYVRGTVRTPSGLACLVDPLLIAPPAALTSALSRAA